MASPAQQLYTATYNAGCTQLYIVPAEQTFISLAFTIFFIVILPRILPGVTSKAAFSVNLLIYLWYVVCFVIAIYNDYMFFDKRPNFEDFARCLLNREYNDKLGMRVFILNLLSLKLVAGLYSFGSAGAARALRIFNFVLLIFGLAALLARGVAGLASGIGMIWPYVYVFFISALGAAMGKQLQENPGYLYLAGFEAVSSSGSGEEKRAQGIQLMALAEYTLKAENGEDASIDIPATIKTADEDEGDQEEEMGQPRGASAANGGEDVVADDSQVQERLTVQSEHFDKSVSLHLFIYIVCTYFTVWILVVAWDWKYGNSKSLGISYKDSFLAFDSVRPTVRQLYDNRGKLTAEQAAYIASLFA